METTIVTVLVILMVFVFFIMGLGIGISMGLAGFIGCAAMGNVQGALSLVAKDIYTIFSSYNYTVIPLFVLMGQIGANAGMAKSLYNFGYKFLGHISGGLAIATVVGATLFKAVCGSTTATTATFATFAIPEMDRYGYDKRLSCGTVATVGTLGAIIPPSVILIIYGLLTETSIGKLFLAGIIPGLMIAFSFAVTLFGWCKINPKLGPKGEKSTWKERVSSLPPTAGIIIIFIIVVGGLMIGVFTPTEAGSVGAISTLILAFVQKNTDLKGFIKSIMSALNIACMVFILIAGATILGHFFALTRIPFKLTETLGALSINRNIIMILIIIVYLIGGSVIDDLAFVILITPIFLPVVLKLGYDPIWFGTIVCVTLMIGIIIPPIAINVFIVSGIAKVPLGTVYKGTYPYLIGMSICLLLILFFPQISLWLPNLLTK